MKNLIATTLFLLVTLVILGYKWWQTGSEEKQIHLSNVEHTTKVIKKAIAATTIEEKIKQENPHSEFKMEDTGIEPEKTINNTKIISPFSEEAIDDMKLNLKPLEGVEPIAAIAMEHHSISRAKIGDTLVLPSIDGNSYEMIIKDKSISATGNVSVHGDYMENGISYHSIITEGKQSSFISMTTPTGTYEINLMNGQGYAYASADIENEKIDYTKSDTIEIPHQEDKERLSNLSLD